MYKKLLLFSLLLGIVGIVGFVSRAAERTTLVEQTNWGSFNWSTDNKITLDYDFQSTDKLVLIGSGSGTVQINQNNPWDKLYEKWYNFDENNGELVLSSSDINISKLGHNELCFKGDGPKVTQILVEKGEPDSRTRTTLVSVNQAFDSTWNDYYIIRFPENLEVGGEIILNISTNGGAQVQVGYLNANGGVSDEDYIERNKDYSSNGEFVIKVTVENIEKLSKYGIRIKGHDYTLTSIDYLGHEPLPTYDNGEEQGGGTDPDPDQPTKSYVDIVTMAKYFADWNAGPYDFGFSGDFQPGDQFIIYLKGAQFTLAYRDADNQSTTVNGRKFYTGSDDNSNNYVDWNKWADQVGDPYTIDVTAENLDVLKNGYMRFQGNNCEIYRIVYYGAAKNVGYRVYGEEPQTPVDPERYYSIIDRIREISLIEPTWTDAEITKDDRGVTFKTVSNYHGVGVMAMSLEDIAAGKLNGGVLDADHFNGVGNYGDQADVTIPETEVYTEDPFLDLHRFDKLIVELAQPATLEVMVYYRDFNYERFLEIKGIENDDERNEALQAILKDGASQQTFTNTSYMEVNLYDFRLIRAISLKTPDGGKEITVTRMDLLEREDYDPDEFFELWVPEEDGIKSYDGVHLGYKSFYWDGESGVGNELYWNSGSHEKSAWQTALEIEPEHFKNMDPNTQYHYFVIIYKNAYFEGAHSEDNIGGQGYYSAQSEVPGQFQLYVNFPFYQTEKEDYDTDFWRNIVWNEDGKYVEKGAEGYDEFLKHNIMIDYMNYEQTLSGVENPIYTPNVRNSHVFRTLKADKEVSNGSFYVSIPNENNHGDYHFAQVYINAYSSVDYPARKASTMSSKRRVSEEDATTEGVETKTGNMMQLLQEHGLAIRGQNVAITKIIYGGNLLEQEDEDLRPDEDDTEDDGTVTGIESIVTEDVPSTVEVYNLQGIQVRRGVAPADATRNLPAGIYIVNGKKVWVK